MTKRTNRNVLICSVVGILILTAASVAWGRGLAKVENTIHNLSATGVDPAIGGAGSSFYATNEDQICVFCHTPHGGILDGPLWNHSTPSNTSFTHYNSVTLSSVLQGLSVSRIVNDESLICMSCHDGSISVNHLINVPNDRTTPIETLFNNDPDTEIIDLFGGVGSRIGAAPGNTSGTGDLTDDHPISFSYSDVLADPAYGVGGSKENELRTVLAATTYKGEGIRFFGTNDRVECSSCHDPHVDYVSGINSNNYTPFLIRPNTGSDLCLSCHNK